MTVCKDVEKRLDIPEADECTVVESGEGTPDGSEPDAALVVPPDGGWGWVIVIASFACNLIVDGIIFSTSFITASIKADFNVSESEVGAVSSILAGFYLMAGPIVSAIANKFGFRAVTIAGSLIGCTGFALSYFATCVQHLYITFGIIGGIGFCMMYLPSVIIVGFYFEKWRALATGLALCGSGVGTFVIAPITQNLVDNYGWKITILVQAGMVLLCIICGILFRPIKPMTVPIIKLRKDDKESTEDERRRFINKLKQQLDQPEMIRNGDPAHTWMGVENNRNYPTVAEVFDKKNERRFSANAVILKEHLLKAKFDVKPTPLSEQDECNKDENATPLLRKPEHTREPMVRPFYRDDILYSGSLQRLPVYKSSNSLTYHLSVTRLPTTIEVKEERTGKCKLCPEAIKRTLFTMLDFELFKSMSFVLLCLSGLFIMLGFFVPYAFVVARAQENNLTTTKWLLPVIGAANIGGRIACGMISSMESVPALWVNNIALTLGGLATAFSGMSYNIYFQHFYCVIYGLALGCFASLRSILVVDYMGLDKLTNSFGLLLLFQGIGALLGTPIAGALKDMTGSLDGAFYLAGGCIILSAVTLYPLDLVSSWENSKKKKIPV